MAFSFRSDEKAQRKSREKVFFIDKPAVSAARPRRNTMGLYIGARVAEAPRPEMGRRMKNV
jgi:hypothetical protein